MIKKNIRIKLTSLREATNDHFFGQLLGEEMDEYEEFEKSLITHSHQDLHSRIKRSAKIIFCNLSIPTDV